MDDGIWVTLMLDNGTEIAGFAPGADSPNDFGVTFKTQLIHLRTVQERRADGQVGSFADLYVNRDHILLAQITEPAGDL